MPMAFMDAEYPSWRAKQSPARPLRPGRCDHPGRFPRRGRHPAATRCRCRTTNLAVGGGEAIEAYAALARALACPIPPRLVIISLDPGHFVHPDLFWERSVRYGFLSAGRHRRAARRLPPDRRHVGL